MDFLDTLLARNAAFATEGFDASLKIIPTRKLLVLGCVDPRVDPMDVLGLNPGEAAIIRNVGGRVNPALVETLDILRTVSKAGGAEMGEGWHLMILQHTKCGIIGCNRAAPHLLTGYFGCTLEELPELAIEDPHRAVQVDVDALERAPGALDGFTVSGLVYAVETGKIEVVVGPRQLNRRP